MPAEYLTNKGNPTKRTVFGPRQVPMDRERRPVFTTYSASCMRRTSNEDSFSKIKAKLSCDAGKVCPRQVWNTDHGYHNFPGPT